MQEAEEQGELLKIFDSLLPANTNTLASATELYHLAPRALQSTEPNAVMMQIATIDEKEL